MSDVRIVVDHLKLEYTGLVDLNAFFRLIDAWLFERGMEKRTDKEFEQQAPKGKFMEWQISSWKKVTDYNRIIFKVRALIYDINKVDTAKDNKKAQLSHCRMLIYFDGYLEHDYEHRWDERPLLVFFRTLYDKFIYRAYTERFEHRLTYDMHHLYDHIESFLNTYRHYRPVSHVSH